MIRYPFSDSDPTAEVTVTVTDGTNPIEDAVVTFTDHDDVGVTFTGTTDSSGETVIEVPLEKYDVTATATGYVDYEHPSQVTVSEDTTLSIAMSIVTDTLTITVNDGENAISGATVTIGSDSETTDENGEAVFDDMPYDDYSVTVEADGYTDATETVQFRSNHKSFTVSLTATGGTGTVTVTCKDSTEENVSANPIILTTEPFNPSSPSLDIVVGMGYATANTGVYTINEFNEQGQPTDTVKDVPFGNYYLYADNHIKSISYTGSLTVDGDEEVTITLIPTNNG